MMNNTNQKLSKIFGGLLMVLIFIAVGIWILEIRKTVPLGKYDNFAKCLSDKGVIMYGADWCPHCQNEKRAFGDSFRLITYVECPDNPQQCIDVNVENYPTWVFPDVENLIGEQGLKKLSEKSDCVLPQGD